MDDRVVTIGLLPIVANGAGDQSNSHRCFTVCLRFDDIRHIAVELLGRHFFRHSPQLQIQEQ